MFNCFNAFKKCGIGFIVSLCLLFVFAVNAQQMVFQSGFEEGEAPVSFGLGGGKAIAVPFQEPTELATIYYPTDASVANKVPVVFLAPGFGGTDPIQYDTILRFIASHGFAAVFVEDNDKFDFSSTDMIADIVAMVANQSDILDTTRIGVVGHSSGGGYAFNILDKLSDVQGWGVNGRFIFITEPWYAFGMMQSDMLTLPTNTNVVVQQYGLGGNSANNGTDARIVLTEYYLLESIADNKKDYQVNTDGDHSYPYGSGTDYSTMQIILAPLDALMQYTFINSFNMAAHDAALEIGNDDPYANGNGIQVVLPRGDALIQYPCNGYNFTDYDIDYCDIKGYPYTSQFDYLATSNNTIQPTLGGVPTIEFEFGTTITRLTQRVNQIDTYNNNPVNGARGNAHPYSKTQAWNADMTMIRLNYRIYDALTFQEVPLTNPNANPILPLSTDTTDTGDLYYINGALNEKKWSTIDPNVFYGVYLTWDKKGQIYSGTIDRAAQTITYDLIHSFGAANTFEKFSLGKFEGNISFDDNDMVFAGRKIGVNYLTAIVYDKAADSFVEKDFDGTNGNALVEWTDSPVPQVFDWVSVSALGNYIIMSTSGNLELYDMDLNYIGQLSDEATHGDMGIAQNGEEVFVSFKFTVPQGVFAHRLQKFVDEVNTPGPIVVANYHHQLLPEKYNGGHISCRNTKRPGWCYLSTVAEGNREVAALRINFGDMSLNVVNRFAQTHTSSQTSTFGGVSPDGKRVMFFSDWEDGALNYYDRDTYQAQRVD